MSTPRPAATTATISRPQCGVYLRISDDPGNDELGVQRQEKWALRFCEDYGWDAVVFKDNDRSATNGKTRERYEALLAAVADGELCAVAAWGQDRLCRQPSEFEHFRSLAKANSVLFATRIGIKNLARAADTFNARNEVNAASYEIENMKERMVEKFVEIADDGRAWWPTRPFGYTMPQRIDRRTFTKPELVKREARAIRKAYDDVMGGSSLKSIARQWNADGLRTPPTGGCDCEPAPAEFPCPTCNRKRRSKPEGTEWTSMSVRAVLLAPRNAALRSYHGEVVGAADWPAIVPEQVWRGVKGKLTDPARLTPGAGFTAPRKYLLSGVALCSECGHPVSGIADTKKTGRPAYVCKRRGCLAVRRSVADVDGWVRGHILVALARDLDVLMQRKGVDTTALLARLTECEAEKDQAAAMVHAKQITLSQLAIINADFDREISEINAAMRDADKAAVLDPFVGVSDVAALFDSLPLDRQRAVIRLLCSVVIRPGQAPRRPFDKTLVTVTPKT